ncbi:cardiolipin synthase [Bacteroides sp. 224]|uniref:cardiolipin synthase n=1 Tax=Bacteroides sp. 224 TaxID=2302936 RepID=UPI0013D5DF3E|nr:cardiolipin synthase [Bacteroides sp. 224]NDV65628.1 cardiolipin synthase [Bacteroides sp. 224]
MKLHIIIVLCFITLLGKAQNSDSLVIQYLTEHNIHVTHDNSVTLLPSGTEKFVDLFAHIKEAKHHIHMEYFNFRNDSIASEMFGLLVQKAKEGVKVRLMFDAFGNSSNNKPLKKKHLKAIREQGIEIVKFDPINFPYINHVFHRDHRKIVVLDGKVGYTGGMNVADYYIQGLPEIGKWRDMHTRIEGSAVKDLQDIFLKMWNKQTKQGIQGDIYYPETAGNKGNKTIAIVDRYPRKDPKTLRRAIVESINEADSKIQIVNPYFTPTQSIKKALKKALKRGVDVEIMISEKSDIPFTPDAVFHISHRFMERGAIIYIYQDGFHHSKIMMVDESFCTVGSTNLNSRSLRYDYEANAFIFNKETTEELMDLFENDKEQSIIMTEEYWQERSRWRRFVGWFANILSPFI